MTKVRDSGISDLDATVESSSPTSSASSPPAPTIDTTSVLKSLHIQPRTSSLQKKPVQETLVKIMLLGNSDVGKSQLFNRLTKSKFNAFSKPTAGIDFSSYTIKIESSKAVKAQIVDTSGLERYRSVTQQYWALAHGAIVVYDITNRESFLDVKRWVRDFRSKFNPGVNSPVGSRPPSPASSDLPDPVIMIIGNKTDLDIEREVMAEEAQAYALANDFLFMETSAQDDRNVQLAFTIFVTSVYHNISSYVKPVDRTIDPSTASAASTVNGFLSATPISPMSSFYQGDRRKSFDQVFLDSARNLIGNFNKLLQETDDDDTTESKTPESIAISVPRPINLARTSSIPELVVHDTDGSQTEANHPKEVQPSHQEEASKLQKRVEEALATPTPVLNRSRSVAVRKSRYL